MRNDSEIEDDSEIEEEHPRLKRIARRIADGVAKARKKEQKIEKCIL